MWPLPHQLCQCRTNILSNNHYWPHQQGRLGIGHINFGTGTRSPMHAQDPVCKMRQGARRDVWGSQNPAHYRGAGTRDSLLPALNEVIVPGVAHYCFEIQYLKTHVYFIVWQRCLCYYVVSFRRFRPRRFFRRSLRRFRRRVFSSLSTSSFFSSLLTSLSFAVVFFVDKKTTNSISTKK